MKPVRVFVMSGSLRTGSLNERLAKLAARAASRHGAEVDEASIADFDVPLFDQDDETRTGLAPGARDLCEQLKGHDAFILVSPEYNASMSGVVKNLIDWVSRAHPQPFNGKQALLMSASPSMAGGNRGLWALRVPLEHLGARVYPDMFSLAQAHTAFAEDGGIANPVLQKRFDEVMGCFLDLVEAAKHYPVLKKQWFEFLGEHPDAATNRAETSEPVVT